MLENENGQEQAGYSTTDTRFAAILLTFGAELNSKIPLEWVDIHESRENFFKNREDPKVCPPKSKVTWHLSGTGKKVALMKKAFSIDLEKIDERLDEVLDSLDLPGNIRDQINTLVLMIATRACHETLLNREELIKWIKSVPQNAKFDGLKSGNTVVLIGKRASPEVQAKYLSKLSD